MSETAFSSSFFAYFIYPCKVWSSQVLPPGFLVFLLILYSLTELFPFARSFLSVASIFSSKDRLFIEANEIEKKADEIVSFASSIDGIKLSGSYYDREKNAPVILFFRGLWSSSFVDAIPIYEITKKMNWNLLITTSRAHGESGGNFSTLGVLEKYDCRDWANWVMEHWGRQTPIFLMGVSMGGATVMMSSNGGLPD